MTTQQSQCKAFINSLLKQRKLMIQAEKGNYQLKVIAAYDRLDKVATVINAGKHKNDPVVWCRVFKNNEADIRLIMFGKNAKQYDKINEAFSEAFKEVLTTKNI